VNVYIYIYIVPNSDCDEKKPGGAVLKALGELRIICGCKEFTTSLLLQASCTVISIVILQGGDLLTQSETQHDCSEESGLQFNITPLSIDVIKYILFNVVGFYLYIILYMDEIFCWNRRVSKRVTMSSR
jgi:hypothetical protein